MTLTRADVDVDQGLNLGEVGAEMVSDLRPSKPVRCPCGGRLALVHEKAAPCLPAGLCVLCEKVYTLRELEALP